MATTPTDPPSPDAVRRPRRWWLRTATFWMAVQSLALAVVHLAGPNFAPIRRNDSALYIELARTVSAQKLLGSIRTPGYPLMLRAVEWVGGGFSLLPALQLTLYLLAVVGLCALLERRGLSPLAAFAATTPLLYISLVRHLAPSIMTDIPAASLALASCALLLWHLSAAERPGSVRRPGWLLAGFGVCLTLSWLLRPSYVFLVVYLPTVVLWMPPAAGGRALPRASRLRLAATVAALGLLPLLAYSAVRWWQVGHFAPTSFGGHNLVGVAGSLVAEERVDSMPADDRDLARRILSERPRRHMEPFDAGTPFAEWERNHNKNSWRISLPWLRHQWLAKPAGPDGRRTGKMPKTVWIDRYLAGWSARTIRGRPGLYSVWLLRATGAAAHRTLTDPWIWAPGAALLLALCAYLWRRPRGSRLPDAARTARSWLVFSAGYLLVSLALVLPMQPPRWRYLTAAMLLLPGALLAMAVELAIARRRRRAG